MTNRMSFRYQDSLQEMAKTLDIKNMSQFLKTRLNTRVDNIITCIADKKRK